MQAKVLIVDDEPEIRAFCKDNLIDVDYQVYAAADGVEAFDMAKQKQFNVVVSDIRMPRMSGFKLLENLKKLNPSPAVILYSGFIDAQVAVEAVKFGAFDFVEKLVFLKEMHAIIDKALQKNLNYQNTAVQKQTAEQHTAPFSDDVHAIQLLQNFDRATAQEFLRLGETRFFESNENIIKEGSEDDKVFIIIKGEISIWQGGAELYRLNANESYGEMRIFRHNFRVQTLTSETSGRIVEIGKSAILDFFKGKEEKLFKLFVFNTLNSLYSKLRKASSNVVQLERMLKK